MQKLGNYRLSSANYKFEFGWATMHAHKLEWKSSRVGLQKHVEVQIAHVSRCRPAYCVSARERGTNLRWLIRRINKMECIPAPVHLHLTSTSWPSRLGDSPAVREWPKQINKLGPFGRHLRRSNKQWSSQDVGPSVKFKTIGCVFKVNNTEAPTTLMRNNTEPSN
jgi:hypothetical protein